jgi:hypothetical protein
MSYWAEIDENNKVLRVTVGDDNDANGDKGYQWLIDNLGGTWIETSQDGSIRKNYANKGFTYNPIADVFISLQPYPSWSLDENFDWQAPTPMPTEGFWTWDESSLNWVESTIL